jgi:hypothetical protein
MNYFRFSCDTNVLISSSFYYRFRSLREVFKEDTYDLSISIMRYFERIYIKTGVKFGFLTRSTLQEINSRKLMILRRKLEEHYKKDRTKFQKVLNEMSAALNKIDDNLSRILLIFQKGKAYLNDKRVRKIYNKVEAMYDGFIKESINLEEFIEKEVSKRIDTLFTEFCKDDEDLKKIEIAKEITRQTQIFQLSMRGSEIGIKDKEILAEVIYEKKRCIQEKPLFKNNFYFYFISEDTHFSEKHINRFGGTISRPITDKINKLFGVKCVRIKEFFTLIQKQQLNVSK